MKNFRYLMTTVHEILLLVDEDMIVEVEKTKRSNGFDRIVKSPSRKTCPKPRPPKITKSRRGCRYLTLYPVKKKLCTAGF